MSVPRSHSVPQIATFQTTKTPTASSSSGVAERHVRPQLPRHRSAVGIAGHSHHLVSVYTPRVEREDPFSLSGFFPTSLAAREHPDSEQEWDWLRAATDEDGAEEEEEYRSGRVSPISESDSEWNVPTPCSPDMEDVLAGDAIKREDKLGILALSGASPPFLLSQRRLRRSRWCSCTGELTA